MEINLFSQCVKELIVENDRVDVPYLGTFTAELMPATYSDRQTTLNPPYRKMSFHKQAVTLEEGRLLLDKVCELAGVTLEQAGVELGWCLSRLSSELEGRKSCKLPGLGMMRANARNEFFFVPDDKLDIWPDGIGFEPVSIRVSEKEESSGTAGGDWSREHFSRSEMPDQVRHDEGQVRHDEGQVRYDEGQVRYDEERHDERRKHAVWEREEIPHSESRVSVVRIVLVALAVLAVLFIAASYLFTDAMSPILDRLLYTKEELELLRR